MVFAETSGAALPLSDGDEERIREQGRRLPWHLLFNGQVRRAGGSTAAPAVDRFLFRFTPVTM